KSFLPFAPEFVGADRVSTIYRDLGRSVVEGLWGRPCQAELQTRIKNRVNEWRGRHPLGMLLAPLCERREQAQDRTPCHLKAAIESDEGLRGWVEETVTEDLECLAPRLPAALHR